MTCEFAFDDGAYVLGSLAPAERAAFERHLGGCAPCRKSVASLAVLPGLLRRLDSAAAVAVSQDRADTASPVLLPRLLAAAAASRARDRRRRRWSAVAAAVAAVFLAVLVGVGVHIAEVDRPAVAMSAMQPAAERVPVTAEVGLATVAGGTMVEMTCRYASGYDGQWTLRLVVFPRTGGPAEQISTWTARSGQEITVEAMTHLTTDEIARVELRRADDRALLTWSPP
jgi:anti-sigma factor RsiW